MTMPTLGRSLAAALLVGLTVAYATAVQARHDAPPAPAVLEIPQPFVPVPTVPKVHYAPDNPLDVFLYQNRYYAWQDGWFVTRQPGQPWTYVQPHRVPRAVVLVPAQYYKRLPPGQAKKLYGTGPPGHSKHRHGHHGDDDGDHDHNHDHDDD